MAQAVGLGLDKDKIHVCGLPLREMFWEIDTSAERKRHLRVELALDPQVVAQQLMYAA
jgi:hypothetical protein